MASNRPFHWGEYSKRSKLRIIASRKHRDIENRNEIAIEENYTSSSSEGNDPHENQMEIDPGSAELENDAISGDSEDEEYLTSREDDSESDSDGDEQDGPNYEIQLEDDLNEPRDAPVLPQVPPDNDDPPLYEGAQITLEESLMCILTYALRFNLTGVALNGLLRLISIHCPPENLCLKSLYMFRKYFEDVSIPLRKHFYCSQCQEKLENAKSKCRNCADDPKVTYFLELPIIDQLQKMYQRRGFFNLLRWRNERRKYSNDNYEDIYDGEIYKQYTQPPQFLSNQNNISFTWNSDGVALFKSSRFEIWPLFLCINELPLKHRMRKENLILAGLWFGPAKPQPILYITNIVGDLETLRNGEEFLTPDVDGPVMVQAKVLCGTCDLPASAILLNMKQFNSEYGCHKCLIRTEPVNGNPLARVYPYNETVTQRSQEETDRFAIEAALSGEAVFGVKGKSVVSTMTDDYIRTTVIDSMHCVFLGVVKALLLLWFNPQTGLFRNFLRFVDEKILNVNPPDFVTRLPRSIAEHLKYFKANELKAWFFYYSMPIMKLIMLDLHFHHYSLLVYSIYLLNGPSISEQMIDMANKMIHEFVMQFPDLYGPNNQTCNLHSLLHLPQIVRDFGPLYTTSCFPFENANGILKRLVNGTTAAQLQICSGISIYMSLPELKQKLRRDSIAFKYCQFIKEKKQYKFRVILQ